MEAESRNTRSPSTKTGTWPRGFNLRRKIYCENFDRKGSNDEERDARQEVSLSRLGEINKNLLVR
jgi:hypothetical protein